MTSKLYKLAEYFSFRVKLADSIPPSSGPISSIPSSSKYRIIDFDQFKRVNDEVLDCYVFIINLETNKPIWFRKVQITNETFSQIESIVQKILQQFLTEDVVGKAKILKQLALILFKILKD
jgi:hypothetical protein